MCASSFNTDIKCVHAYEIKLGKHVTYQIIKRMSFFRALRPRPLLGLIFESGTLTSNDSAFHTITLINTLDEPPYLGCTSLENMV